MKAPSHESVPAASPRTVRNQEPDRRFRLALTLGDPAGIGPEVVVRAACERTDVECVLVGDGDLAVSWAERFRCDIPTPVAGMPARDASLPARCVVWDAGSPVVGVRPGRPTESTGRASWDWLRVAVEAAMEGRVDALVTGPVSKSALRKAGFPYPGQTEFLAEACGAGRFAMLLCGGGLAVLPVTRHVPLREVPDLLTIEGIAEAVGLAHDFGRRAGLREPRVAVAALNPHSGEGGLLGREEREIIEPAVAYAIARGWTASGPFPADTLFHEARNGRWDVVVCMYHDQGLIPLKMIAFHEGVNITLGLPIVRTSPDHGTAFDIAGRGTAEPGSVREAVVWALRLSGQDREG